MLRRPPLERVKTHPPHPLIIRVKRRDQCEGFAVIIVSHLPKPNLVRINSSYKGIVIPQGGTDRWAVRPVPRTAAHATPIRL